MILRETVIACFKALFQHLPGHQGKTINETNFRFSHWLVVDVNSLIVMDFTTNTKKVKVVFVFT